MWERIEERLLLLELLVAGRVSRRRTQEAAYDLVAAQPWTRRTGRAGERRIVEAHRAEVAALIDRVWPAWHDDLGALTAAGLPCTPDGWRKLGDRRRAARIGTLPEEVNRRIAASLTAADSKARLSPSRRATLGEARVTHDGIVRLRCPRGLRAELTDRALDLHEIALALGEVALPERAFLGGLKLEGPLRALLLVENLGPWRDLPAPDGWLLAHVPGWDTSTVRHLLASIGDAPVIHFGDLDPNGARIHAHLRDLSARVQWFVPSFWEEKLDENTRRTEWPDHIVTADAPSLVQRLAKESRWLEQEAIVLDPRLPAALESRLTGL